MVHPSTHGTKQSYHRVTTLITFWCIVSETNCCQNVSVAGPFFAECSPYWSVCLAICWADCISSVWLSKWQYDDDMVCWQTWEHNRNNGFFRHPNDEWKWGRDKFIQIHRIKEVHYHQPVMVCHVGCLQWTAFSPPSQWHVQGSFRSICFAHAYLSEALCEQLLQLKLHYMYITDTTRLVTLCFALSEKYVIWSCIETQKNGQNTSTFVVCNNKKDRKYASCVTWWVDVWMV